MTYAEFLNDINKYVGCVMRFTTTIKTTGKTHITERYVWDNKEFGEQKQDCLVEVIKVEFVRKGRLHQTTGITGIY